MSILHQQGVLADEKLRAQGLVLTQGGEPTLVPEDTSAPEWNIAALGREKLVFARKLAARLTEIYLPGALVLQSSGKQFPGEPVPRWSLGLFRLKDGPLWKDPSRLRLDDSALPSLDLEFGKTVLEKVARRLACSTPLIPAYEDVEGWMRFKESQGEEVPLPRFSKSKRVFVTPPSWAESEAARWEALCGVKGWVLPLWHDGAGWQSPVWTLPPGEDLTLLVGSSPIGLRLPLGRVECAESKCAMSVEIRDGEFCLFLPPLPSLQAFQELAGAVEMACVELGAPPVVLEGYPPARSPELESFSMMSDPGVLEINLPPAGDWGEFERVIRKVYEAASTAGLRGYKYQFSGRKVSTGGGAHIVMGGPTPEQSPFRLRPDLLASLLRFVQNHPSLSYVFTGQFIGPSSQAPPGWTKLASRRPTSWRSPCGPWSAWPPPGIRL
jgi:uncharacterized protein (DUF2126 family)